MVLAFAQASSFARSKTRSVRPPGGCGSPSVACGAVDLSGTWRATAADDELRRSGIGLDVADDEWTEVARPRSLALVRTGVRPGDGPILYRKRFELPGAARRGLAAGSRSTASSTRPMSGPTVPTSAIPRATSSPHSFDVRRPVPARRRPRAGRRGHVQPRAGHGRAAQHHRPVPALRGRRSGLEPGWHLARRLVYDTGPVKLDRLRVLCRDADETRAHLRLHTRLDSDAARTVRLRTSADGVVVGETEHPLAAGVNEIEWSLDVDRPQLWWPHAVGDQPLTTSMSASSSTASSAIVAPGGRAFARWRGTTGSARSTASGCS